MNQSELACMRCGVWLGQAYGLPVVVRVQAADQGPAGKAIARLDLRARAPCVVLSGGPYPGNIIPKLNAAFEHPAGRIAVIGLGRERLFYLDSLLLSFLELIDACANAKGHDAVGHGAVVATTTLKPETLRRKLRWPRAFIIDLTSRKVYLLHSRQDGSSKPVRHLTYLFTLSPDKPHLIA